MKINTPKRVTLPNSRIFVAWYKQVSRAQLPANITIRQRCAQRATPKKKRRKRGQQKGHGIYDFVKKVIKNPIVTALAVKHLPDLYNSATNRIRNNNIRRALQSDTAKNLVTSTANRLLQTAGISNITIEKVFENENDDLKKRYSYLFIKLTNQILQLF